MKEKETREKLNREQEEDGLSPLPTLETTPEPDLSPSGLDDVDYLMPKTPNTEAAGGQTSGQRRAGAEAPSLVVGERKHARMMGARAPTRPGVETLKRVTPPRYQVGVGAQPIGHSMGAGGMARAPRSSSRKRKLDAALR